MVKPSTWYIAAESLNRSYPIRKLVLNYNPAEMKHIVTCCQTQGVNWSEGQDLEVSE